MQSNHDSYNIRIVGPNENDIGFDSPSANSLQLQYQNENASSLAYTQTDLSSTLNSPVTGYNQNTGCAEALSDSITIRPVSPRPHLPQLDITGAYMQSEVLSLSTHPSPSQALLEIQPWQNTAYSDGTSPSLSAGSIPSYYSTAQPSTASPPYFPTGWVDSQLENEIHELMSLQRREAQLYSPTADPPLTPSPTSPYNTLSPNGYANNAYFSSPVAGTSASSGSPTFPGLSPASGHSTSSPYAAQQPLTPSTACTPVSVTYPLKGGFTGGSPHAFIQNAIAPSPYMDIYNSGTLPSPSHVGAEVNLLTEVDTTDGSDTVSNDGTVSNESYEIISNHLRTKSATAVYYTTLVENATQIQETNGQTARTQGVVGPMAITSPSVPIVVPMPVPMLSHMQPTLALSPFHVRVNPSRFIPATPRPPSPEITLGPFIPQKPYRPHTASDRRRYVDEVALDPPIRFTLRHSSGSCTEGIPLNDALHSRFMRLEGRDQQLFVKKGPSISVRLVWEGYSPWSRQIPTRDFRAPPGPITRAKLAKNVAKTVQRFIEEHKNNEPDPHSDRRFAVGPGRITVEDLMLVSMHHVSMGSWQAHLRLLREL